MQSPDEQVNSPKHYQFSTFQAIDVIEGVARSLADDPVAAVLTSHALKYLMRWPRKHGLRDLKKARWYLDRLIARLEGGHVQPSGPCSPPSLTTVTGIPTLGTNMPNMGIRAHGNPATPHCATWQR